MTDPLLQALQPLILLGQSEVRRANRVGMSRFDAYYMSIAAAVAAGARCRGRHVGSVIVRKNRIISTGYNGTPEAITNCDQGGCPRCDPANKEKGAVSAGGYYDVCLCVHAEENALMTAARFGSSVEDGEMYTTLQPCFICLRELLQAGIRRVVFAEPWSHPAEEKLPWIGEGYQTLAKALDFVQFDAAVV